MSLWRCDASNGRPFENTPIGGREESESNGGNEKYITEALKEDGFDDETSNTVIAVLTASLWKLKMLQDPSSKQDLAADLQYPWDTYCEKNRKPYGMDALEPSQLGKLSTGGAGRIAVLFG